MTVSELKQQLEKLENEGWGNLHTAVIVQAKNYAPGARGALIKSCTMGDIGGWGNYTVYIETHEELESLNEKKI